MKIIDASGSQYDDFSWFLVHFDNAKTHVVQRRFLSPLIKDLKYRNFNVVDVKGTTSITVDLGGSIIIGMPSESITISDETTYLNSIKVRAWSHQVNGIKNIVENYIDEKRKFANNLEYYKIHFPNCCFVLNEDQIKLLYNSLILLTPQAEQTFTNFMKSWKNKNLK